jgi:peptide/nickel transport system substrate-binding protein
MQNRFTVKDFFYVLIGLTACGLLFMNMLKTNREVVELNDLKGVLQSQQATLASLGTALEGLQSRGGGMDADAVDRLAELLRNGSNGAAALNGTNGASSRLPVGPVPGRPVNLASPPSFDPGYDNRYAIWTDSVNPYGLPQEWQVAPDESRPDDFSSGDTLIRVWATDAQKLTPLVSTDAYSRRVFYYTHEYLVQHDLDAPFGSSPGLAKAWEVSDDGMELTFHLHENATWSDKTPVTADDVIFTWDTALNEKMDTAHLRGYLKDNIASYEKLGPHTVRFKMKQPYFDAVSICGQLMFITPKHIYGQFDEETFNKEISDLCVGSGPYVLEKWEKNSQIVLVRNENYWGPKPALDRIIIRVITNDLPKIQEFKAGNVDLITPTAEQWTSNVESPWFRDAGHQPFIYYSPRGGYTYIGYNMRRPHFADKRTRQALTMLIDRQAFIDTLLDGMGKIISGPFFFKSDQYNRAVEPWPYDPARARELLKEVGWEDSDGDGVIDMDLDGDGIRDPFEVTYLLPSGGALGEKIQRFVQEAFRNGGIKLNLDRLEWSVFLERLHERQFDMVTLSWTGNPEGDPYQIWHSASEPNRGSNAVGFVNPRADELIERGRGTIDYDERMAIWHEFHALVNEEQPYTFLYARPDRRFLHWRFKNAEQRDYRQYYSEWYVPSADQDL